MLVMLMILKYFSLQHLDAQTSSKPCLKAMKATNENHMVVLEGKQKDHQRQINWLGTKEICAKICFNPGDVRCMMDHRICDIKGSNLKPFGFSLWRSKPYKIIRPKVFEHY